MYNVSNVREGRRSGSEVNVVIMTVCERYRGYMYNLLFESRPELVVGYFGL